MQHTDDRDTNPLYLLQIMLGISRPALAEELGMSLPAIYNHENAGRFPLRATYPTWKTLERLTKRALETCPDHPGVPALYEAARSADFEV